MATDSKPYWYPKLTDAAWCEEKRQDYPSHKDWTDDQLRDHYADGNKYQTLWDHVGDAYDDWEKLADAYLALVSNGSAGSRLAEPTQ